MANELASELDHVFHALSDPTRRSVVQSLSQGPATVTALAEPFSMALPTFLKHLKVLETAGLVETQKRGRIRHCALRPHSLRAAEKWIGDHMVRWDAKLDSLERYLNEQDRREKG